MLRKITASVLLPSIVALTGCLDDGTRLPIGYTGDAGAGSSSAAGSDSSGSAGASSAGSTASGSAGSTASGSGGSAGTDPVWPAGGAAQSTGGSEMGGGGGIPEPPEPWEITGTVDKVDLLLVLDNSQSSEKQRTLMEAVPRLVEGLVNPPCVENGKVVAQPASASDACSSGTRRSVPVSDLHVGLITSSLGSAGGALCTSAFPDGYSPEMEDMAHLIGTVRSDVSSYKNLGFLRWDSRPPGERDPDATDDVDVFSGDLVEMIAATGSRGCGFEAPLEAWYRFLIDPAPYASIEIDGYQGTRVGVDQAVLDQRAAFLRDDSAVAIVMLNDENDCSIQPDGIGSLVGTFSLSSSSFNMRRSTLACEDDPNDPCCISCASLVWPSGCAPKSQACPNGDVLFPEEDAANLRCFEQKRRFGIDFLQPTSRYVVGLTSPTLCPNSTYPDADCSCRRARQLGVPCDPGEPVRNPLFANRERRSPATVVLTGLLGVPWQDVVTPESLADTDLADLLSPAELRQNVPGQNFSYWDLIAGSPKDYVRPSDPFMVESTTPREGSNPITGDELSPPESSSPLANPINGHEWEPGGRDLQHACIYPLATPIDCAIAMEDEYCECAPSAVEGAELTGEAQKNPLCQNDAGVYTTDRSYGKVYPTLRQLEVLKDFGDNALVSSACPKTIDSLSTIQGYWPAMDALAERLGTVMTP